MAAEPIEKHTNRIRVIGIQLISLFSYLRFHKAPQGFNNVQSKRPKVDRLLNTGEFIFGITQ
ncbi:hypothetical protein BV923_08715 [Pectobacterium odoriferum]|nr:hypothetical protein BV923_08715 [Pectobacterium odoriferum]